MALRPTDVRRASAVLGVHVRLGPCTCNLRPLAWRLRLRYTRFVYWRMVVLVVAGLAAEGCGTKPLSAWPIAR